MAGPIVRVQQQHLNRPPQNAALNGFHLLLVGGDCPAGILMAL